jgi:hypothetical protein
MMRMCNGRIHVGLALLGALAVTPLVGGAIVDKVALLNGNQEVPPQVTSARGSARMVVDTTANTLTYRISYSGLAAAETAAHFHGPAAIGANAPVVQGLPAGNPKVGVWTYPEALEPDILANRIYINIHTGAFPGGEIRGQVVDMVAYLDGVGENPPTGSTATGYGLFGLDPCANELTYHIQFSGLSAPESDAHLHGFALHDANTDVLEHLPAGSPKVGVFTYSQLDEAAILDGRMYVNIHSDNFPAGEIRGHVTRIVAPMDPAQEVPPLAGLRHGTGLFAIDTAANGLSFHMGYQNLTGAATAAHIHGFAAPGVNAGVQFGIGTANPVKAKWTYPEANEGQVLGGLTYLNVHNGMNPGGEIRGQIIFPMGVICPEDVNCDGQIDVSDLVDLILEWGTAGPASDIDGNGVVDVNDMVLLILAWGACT